MTANYIDNRYKIISKIGEGGMGSVFLVEDTLKGDTRFVIKQIKDFFSVNAKTDFEKKFKAEYEIMTKLSHPNLIKVYDFKKDRINDNYYIVMEYLEGDSLKYLLEAKKISVTQAIEVLINLLRALEFVHSRNIVFMDVKPENIMIIDSNNKIQVKLLDFGLANNLKLIGNNSSGTIRYMSPQSACGLAADKQTDIFSLGIVFYEMMTGQGFFCDKKNNETIKILQNKSLFSDHLNLNLEKISSNHLKIILSKMLAYNYDFRYKNCAEIITDINKNVNMHVPVETEETKAAYFKNAPYVGKDFELSFALEHLFSKDQSLLLVSGDRGLGKTRFLQELKKQCLLNDALVFSGEFKCDNPIEFGAFINIFNKMIVDSSSELLDRYGQELAVIFSDHKQLQKYISDSESQAKLDMPLIINSLAKYICDYAKLKKEPVLLFLDDFHCVDNNSLKIIKDLFYNINLSDEYLAIKVIVSSIDDNTSYENFLIDFSIKEQLKRIELKPFTNSDMKEYVECLIGDKENNTKFIEKIISIAQKTSGNPYFFEQILNVMIEKGDIYRNSVKWAIKTESDDFTVSSEIKDFIDNRLKSLNLNNLYNELLKYLAIFNNTVTVTFFSEITNVPAKEINLFFDFLAAKKIIIEHYGQFSIVNNILKEAINAYCPVEENDRICILIADRLEANFLKNAEDLELDSDIFEDFSTPVSKKVKKHHKTQLTQFQIEEIATYYDKVKNVDKAFFEQKMLPLLLNHAQNLYDFCNYKQAKKVLEKLDKYSDQFLDSDPKYLDNKYRIYKLKGLALRVLSEWDNSLIAFKKAEMLFADNVNYLDKKAEIYLCMISVCSDLSDLKSAEKYYNSVSDIVNKSGNQKLKAEALVAYAGHNIYLHYNDLALSLLIQAEEIAKTLFNENINSSIFNKMGVLFLRNGEYEKALIYFQKALTFYNKINSKFDIASVSGNIAGIYRYLSKYDLSLKFYNNALIIFNEIGDRQLTAVTLGNIALVFSTLNETDKVMDCYLKQIKICREIGYKSGLAHAYLGIANLNNDLGNFDLALNNYQKAVTYYKEIDDLSGIVAIKINMGFLELQKGNHQKAVDTLEVCVDDTIKFGMKIYQAYCLEYLSLAYFNLKNYSAALKAINESKDVFAVLSNQSKVNLCIFHQLKINFFITEQLTNKKNILKEMQIIVKENENDPDYNEYLFEFWLLLKNLPADLVTANNLEKVRKKCLEVNQEKLKTDNIYSIRENVRKLSLDITK